MKKSSAYKVFKIIFTVSLFYWVFWLVYLLFHVICDGPNVLRYFFEDMMGYTLLVFPFIPLYQIIFIICWLERKRRSHIDNNL